MARTYRALAALLSYPTAEVQAATAEIAEVLAGEGLLSAARCAALRSLLDDLARCDLYDLQERYVALFDCGRALSLHLFEHIHGESRDRGQAMADLVALYADHGLTMRAGELPDFLPLFLEFLSVLPDDEARALLAEPAAILRALADRLAGRDGGYGAVMEVLAGLANAPAAVPAGAPAEDVGDLAAVDAAWEEEAVRFGPGAAGEGCSVDRLRARLRAAARDATA
jgi:nitrate reductase delta subunit